MGVWVWAWTWVCVWVWACGSQATSPIRISVYGYADPDGFGRKESPTIHITRPRRNATFVATSAEITDAMNMSIVEDTGEGEGEDGEAEGKAEDEGEVRGRSRVAVNRMGIPSRVVRRKLRPLGRRRSNEPEEDSDTAGGRAGLPPGVRPPAPPPAFLPPSVGLPPGINTPAPPIRPPAPPTPIPPILPPATPPSSLPGSSFGPPAVPPPISAPAPPPGADQAQVTEIKCMDTGSTSSFMAVLSLPLGHNAIPVFEDRPSVDPTINTACRMIPTQLTNDMFQLIVSDLDRCGVRKCRQPNGEVWMCLQLRFPLVNGLKLPEDAIIQIRCRPQDKTAQDTHVLRVATAKYAAKEAM